MEVLILLHLLDPVVTLSLWINHQWPSLRILHDDGVINCYFLLWKLIDVPFLDLDTISKHNLETEAFCTLDLERVHKFHPVLNS